MDKTVPKAAGRMLDFIAEYEAPKGYDTVYGNNQARMVKPLTTMRLDEVLNQGKLRTNKFGSSAAGRYQFMDQTLRTLSTRLGLRAHQKFDPDLQDRLAYHLLRERGYDKWASGEMTDASFMLNLAKEWAALPIPYDMSVVRNGRTYNLKKGQSYYAGDKVGNKARVKVSAVENMLKQARADLSVSQPDPVAPPPLNTDPRPDDAGGLWAALTKAAAEWFLSRKKV
jgi:muramidase (phage lysozyme)